jgi:hypothetical protein
MYRDDKYCNEYQANGAGLNILSDDGILAKTVVPVTMLLMRDAARSEFRELDKSEFRVMEALGSTT